MKKTLTTVSVILLFSLSLAPAGQRVLHIHHTEGINPYLKLIDAVVWVESRGDPYAYNDFENAVGAFQIRQIRVDHYNRLTGSVYQLSDCYDYELSKRIFLYFAHGKTLEKAAKDWNGSGPMTDDYWEKVRNLLISNQ